MRSHYLLRTIRIGGVNASKVPKCAELLIIIHVLLTDNVAMVTIEKILYMLLDRLYLLYSSAFFSELHLQMDGRVDRVARHGDYDSIKSSTR